ncbi:MAG: sugar phosphate isomerase/epimerase [Planctomycetaceae bacterium]|nr:sugar phosphate isomerase/epimerase [Planctomycetaceae bacterium]
MRKSISVQTMFVDVPLYERFGKAREVGFDFVELSDWTQLDLTRVRQELDRHRLHVSAVGGSGRESLMNPSDRDNFIEYLSQSCAVAKTFMCQNIVLDAKPSVEPTGRPGAKPTEVQLVAAAALALQEASAKAIRTGMSLFLRPLCINPRLHDTVQNVKNTGDIVRVVNSPVVRVCLDCAGLPLASEPVRDTLVALRDLVGYVHVGNESAERLKEIGAALRELIRYEGFVGFTAGGNTTL